MRSDLDDNCERRKSVRFRVTAAIHWRLASKRRPDMRMSVGTTIDMSSSGILFTTHEQLRIGQPLVLAVDWPVALNGSCHLQLAIAGRVVRSDALTTAVRIDRYEFRTCGEAFNVRSLAV